MKVRAMRRIRGITPISAAWTNHADWRLIGHHRANLDGRCLRAQEAIITEPEGIATIHRRMVRGGIQRGEIVKTRFELGTISDREAETRKNRRCFLNHARKRMLDAEFRPHAGTRQITFNTLNSRRASCLRRQSRLDFRAPRLNGLTKSRTLLFRHILHRLNQCGDAPVTPHILHT